MEMIFNGFSQIKTGILISGELEFAMHRAAENPNPLPIGMALVISNEAGGKMSCWFFAS